MMRLRVRVTPDPEVAPRAFQLLADSHAIEETRLLEWNAGDDRRPTLLFSVDGRWDGLAEELVEDPVVEEASVTAVADEQAILLVTIRPQATPMAGAIFDALTHSGLVVSTPVVYRAGTVRATLLGAADVLQSVIDAFPDAVTVEVDAVGDVGAAEPASVLSDRQEQAVLAGLELGYYAVPRRATHRDVADELGCAPSTASEHLQKAEAKLVTAAMSENRW